jgi:hypothetical protein
MTRAGDSARTALQVLGIACGIALLSMIAHKGYTDISLLAERHSGQKFWWALARYFLNNLVGGASPDA